MPQYHQNIMKNKDLCTYFAGGLAAGLTANNLSISYDGSRLFSYNTVIAQRLKNGVVLVNTTRYSPTTSRHQGDAFRALYCHATRENKKPVPAGARDLKKYC